MDSKFVKISGTSSYLPGKPVPFEEINDHLGELVNAPEKVKKWAEKTQLLMKEMLGVDYCHYALNRETRKFDEDNLSLSVKAAKGAIEEAGLQPNDIDLLIYGGSYSHQMPPLSSRIQEGLGIDFCSEMHIHSNCTSVYKSIMVAHDLIRIGRYKNVLVVSSNISSASFCKEYFNQEKLKKEDLFLRWYLCDGAGAMVLQACDKMEKGFYLEHTYIESPGGNKVSAMHTLYPGYWENPIKIYEEGAHHIKQLFQKELSDHSLDKTNGKTIFYNGLKRMIESQKINLDSLKYLMINMPTKAVRGMIVEECLDLGIKPEHIYSAIENIGYTGPPAAIISLDKLLKTEKFKDNDYVISFVMEVSKFMQGGYGIRVKT